MSQTPDLATIPPSLVAVVSPTARTQAVVAEVDARQLACPLPLLKAKQGLRDLASGDVLRILATDAGSLRDFVAFAQLAGHQITGFSAQEGEYCYLICKR